MMAGRKIKRIVHQIKVGDRVLIVKKSNSRISWVPAMDKSIGEIGEVLEVRNGEEHGHYFIYYLVKVMTHAFNYNFESLKIVKNV